VPMFRNVTLKSLTEIAAVSVPHYDEKFIALFSNCMERLQAMLPVETNIKQAYANGMDAEQQFIQDLALFFCSYLKEHGELVEKGEMNETLLKALHYLILISEVEEVEIFKICLEYWNSLASDLYRESPYATGAAPLFMSRPTASNNSSSTPPRRQFYQPVLTKVRYIMISRMAKPEEVLVTRRGSCCRERSGRSSQGVHERYRLNQYVQEYERNPSLPNSS